MSMDPFLAFCIFVFLLVLIAGATIRVERDTLARVDEAEREARHG
jgi:hypothetical protein